MLVRSGLLNCILESKTCRRNGARETGTQPEGKESKKEREIQEETNKK